MDKAKYRIRETRRDFISYKNGPLSYPYYILEEKRLSGVWAPIYGSAQPNDPENHLRLMLASDAIYYDKEGKRLN